MQMLRNGHRRVLRPMGRLAFAIGAALAVSTAGATDSHDRAGAAALRAQLQAMLPPLTKLPQPLAAILPVSSCADDNGPGTLRAVVAAAGEGDTVDLSALTCSAITLSQGAVPVLLNNLTVVGPGAGQLALDGAGVDRVLLHPGGGALTVRQLTVRNGRVTDNRVTGGGCVASAGYVVLDHSVVTGCYAGGEGVYGGGIFAYGLSAYTSTISANVGRGSIPMAGTATFGGGAYAFSIALVDSTVSGNRADHVDAVSSSYEIGGGVFTNYGGQVERSTIEGNYSHGFGGGLSAFGGVLDVVNSTVSGNSAKTACGGGLDVRAFADTSIIENSTIAGNDGASGGGICLRGQPGGFILQSTIASGNSAAVGGADFEASVPIALAGANNLVGSAGAAVTLPAGTLHADPLLQPLGANGGPTRTRALSAGSPALDAGNNVAALGTDQRGFARTIGAGTDIGAFEGFVIRAPVQVPAAARGMLAALAAALLLFGAAAARRRKNVRLFTRPSPPRGHSSHT